MSQDDFRIERILHAYVDGELNAPEKSRLLVKMENDNAIRERQGMGHVFFRA
jgi:anti-sigma factor RsiW